MPKRQITNNVKPKYAIELVDFSIIFNEKTKNEFALLSHLNYGFERGKIHFLVGPSGCGKTVLISHFNGLMFSKHGKILINGDPIISKHKRIKKVKKLRSQIGLVFQFAEYQLFKTTILKDIIFGPMNFGVKKSEAINRAKKLICDVGLDETFLKRNPFGLSGGQKRRVAIAGILAINPDIIVFDEPTAGLDPQGEKEIMNIILELKRQGKTIIVVTHTMNNAIAVADNLVVLNDGKIVKTGSIYEIFADHKLVAETNLSTPLIIQLLQKLSNKDHRFKQILTHNRPRSIPQMVTDINGVIKERTKSAHGKN
ncbi:MAG: ATP-binding cassette domain-containing protein [Mycoplasmataceae bacterium]|jgi:energy-coupling factor transport system ATP-binding protein|nr:ATP-binding cassette domain-containing protein [Mycoplasmataceae bacterium]